MTAPAWGLSPWADAIGFVPVTPDGRAVWRVPKPMGRDWWASPSILSASPEYETLYAKEYASVALGWRDFVYVAAKDESRLLTALQVVERAILVFAWMFGDRKAAQSLRRLGAFESGVP